MKNYCGRCNRTVPQAARANMAARISVLGAACAIAHIATAGAQ